MANQTISGLSSLASPSSAGLLWIYDPNASPQDRSLTLAALQLWLGAKAVVQSGTSYTLAAGLQDVSHIISPSGAFTYNLPASAGLGRRVTIVNAPGASYNVAVNPNGSNKIGLNNLALTLTPGQCVELEDSASGYWTVLGPFLVGQVPSSTPYTASGPGDFLVTTGASAFVFNLPTAASMLGLGMITVVKVDSGAGVIQVAPNGTDVIDKAGNVSCYLGGQWQSLSLKATASGYWAVVGGTFAPHQTVDTDGSQYELGKLRHFPQGNTTSRGFALNLPAGAGVWGAANQATGNVGIPAGAKAIRAIMKSDCPATAAGTCEYAIAFSDNNSNTPAVGTAHPVYDCKGYASAAAQKMGYSVVLDIPLSASGQFYIYGLTLTNIASVAFSFGVLGYYMGD